MPYGNNFELKYRPAEDLLAFVEWVREREWKKVREENGGKKLYMCFTKKMPLKMAQWCSAGWLLFPGASSRWGKAYPSTRVSGIKRPRSICFLSHHGQCLLHLLIYASQDERETQLIKHEHKALGKKDTRRCGEARGSALYMGALCMEWQGDSNVKTLFFFFLAFTNWKLFCQLACWSEFFLTQSQATWFKAFLLILRSGHSSGSHARTT